MRLSDIKDENALDVLAEIIEPLGEILSDEDVKKAWEKNKKLKAISVAIKNHKESVIYIMATLDGVPVKKYRIDLLTLPAKIIEIISDPMLTDFFNSQGQMWEESNSGSAMENTEEKEI